MLFHFCFLCQGRFLRSRPSLADFNGDGKTDVLVFRASDGLVTQWLSNGAGGWTYQPAVYIGGTPNGFSGAQILTGDFNGDGKTDVLVFRSSDGYIAQWLSNGAGGWAYQQPAYAGSPYTQVVTGDFNGDGKTDLLVFQSSNGYLATWLSNGAGGWNYQPAVYIGGTSGNLPGAQIIAGDFNGDGKTDVLVFRSSDGYVAQWFSDGAGGWYYQPAVYIGGTPSNFPEAQILTGDFNGDGKTDALVFRSGDGFLAQWLSNGNGTWAYQPWVALGGGGFSGAQIVTGDFNGDGKTDALVFRSSDGFVGQWLSNGAGGWYYQPTVYIGGAPGNFPDAQILAGDFNGDGRTDVLVFRSSDGFVGQWLSNGAGGWYYQPSVYIGGAPGNFPDGQIIAKAADSTQPYGLPTVQLVNLTHPDLSPNFAAGDTFQVTVTGPPNQPVSVTQTPGETAQMGYTDANGVFVITGVEQTGNIGTYTQVWSAGGVQATPALTFMIGQLGGGTVSATDLGNTPDGHVEGLSTISITNGAVTTYSVTELDYTAQLYYDTYTVAGLYDNGQLVTSAQSPVGSGAEGGSLSVSANAWDTYTLQTDHYVVAFIPYYSYFENPLYYEGYASGEDSSGDLVFGPGGGVLYLVEASIYLGSTLADQVDVPQDGNNIPLADDSVYNSFLSSAPQPQQPDILFKVDAWGRSIRRIIPALFIYESLENSQGQANTYPLPMILQLVGDTQTAQQPVERDRTYLVRDSNGNRWLPYNPLTIFESLNYVAGPGALPPITNDPSLTDNTKGWNTASHEIQSNSTMTDGYSTQNLFGAAGEVDYWQQYWATGFNAPDLSLPGIQLPAYPTNAIPLMILGVNNDIPGACRYYGTQGITLRSDYVGVNGDHGPSGTCLW